MIAKVLSGLVAVVGVFWLFFAGIYAGTWWDRRPAGWPHYEVRCCLVVHWALKFPDSLGAQLAAVKAADAQAAAHAAIVTQRQDAITRDSQAEAVKVRTEIQWRTRTLIKEVPHVLTPEVDRRYPLPVGFVRLYDASLLGLDLSAVRDPAGRADDEASAVAASSAAASAAGNNGECLVDRARLTGLQDWIKRQAEAQR